ncbi:MAG: type II toxin-antitoxin system HicA family toxin [Rhodomicrobium sp.]
MPKIETNARKIAARLKKDGWVNIGGGSHDRFVNEEYPEVMITVPRHKELTSGVARSIAKAVGWI